MASKQLTIRIHRAANKELYFTINGGNGKVIVTSETYKRRQGVDRAIGGILLGISDNDFSIFDHSGAKVKEVNMIGIYPPLKADGKGFETMTQTEKEVTEAYQASGGLVGTLSDRNK